MEENMQLPFSFWAAIRLLNILKETIVEFSCHFSLHGQTCNLKISAGTQISSRQVLIYRGVSTQLFEKCFIYTAIASDQLEIGMVQNSVLDLLQTNTIASVFGSLPL